MLAAPVFLPRSVLRFWGPAKYLRLGYRLPLAARALKRRADWNSIDEMVESYCCRGGFKEWEGKEWIRDYLEGGTVPADDGVRLSCEPKWEAASFAATPHRVWKELRFVTCPLTVVYGVESDTFLPPAAKLLPRIVPHARLVSVPDTGHFVPMENPDVVREEMVRLAQA